MYGHDNPVRNAPTEKITITTNTMQEYKRIYNWDEEIELLERTLAHINPYKIDHEEEIESEEEKGNYRARPSTGQYWLKKWGYDPKYWSDWIMNPYYKPYFEAEFSSMAAENFIQNVVTTSKWAKWELKLPDTIQYQNAIDSIKYQEEKMERNRDRQNDSRKSIADLDKEITALLDK